MTGGRQLTGGEPGEEGPRVLTNKLADTAWCACLLWMKGQPSPALMSEHAGRLACIQDAAHSMHTHCNCHLCPNQHRA